MITLVTQTKWEEPEELGSGRESRMKGRGFCRGLCRMAREFINSFQPQPLFIFFSNQILLHSCLFSFPNYASSFFLNAWVVLVWLFCFHFSPLSERVYPVTFIIKNQGCVADSYCIWRSYKLINMVHHSRGPMFLKIVS